MSAIERQIEELNSGSASRNMKTASVTKDTRTAERASEKSTPRLTEQMLREARFSLIPNVQNPEPGYSYMWLSLNPEFRPNLYEGHAKYYTPCTTLDLPEFAAYAYKGDKVESVNNNHIVIKELILCKIRDEDRQTIMRFNHHTRPAEIERDIMAKYYSELNFSGGRAARLNPNLRFSELEEDRSSAPEGIAVVKLGENGYNEFTTNPIFE